MHPVATITEKKSTMTSFLKLCQKRWQLLVFMLIPFTFLIVFSYLPMPGIQIAFRKYTMKGGIWNSPWVGLANFEKFFNTYYFERVMRNTLMLSFYSLLAGFPLPVIVALMLNAMEQKKLRKSVQTLIYMPHFISTVVMVGIIFQFFNVRIGIYGTIGKAILGTLPPDILANAEAFPHLYVWSGVWKSLGWNTVIYTAALAAVDQELHEAAQIDGASRLQRIIHIDFPGILPTTTILLIMNSGNILSIGFEKIYLMQNNTNLIYSEVISTYSYKVGLSGSFDFSYSTAIGLFNSIVNFLMLLLVNRIAKKVGSTSLF